MYLFIFKYIYRIFRTIFCSSRMLKCQDGRIASHAWACCDFCQHSPRPWSVGIARYNHYLLVELATNMKHNRETMEKTPTKSRCLVVSPELDGVARDSMIQTDEECGVSCESGPLWALTEISKFMVITSLISGYKSCVTSRMWIEDEGTKWGQTWTVVWGIWYINIVP